MGTPATALGSALKELFSGASGLNSSAKTLTGANGGVISAASSGAMPTTTTTGVPSGRTVLASAVATTIGYGGSVTSISSLSTSLCPIPTGTAQSIFFFVWNAPFTNGQSTESVYSSGQTSVYAGGFSGGDLSASNSSPSFISTTGTTPVAGTGTSGAGQWVTCILIGDATSGTTSLYVNGVLDTGFSLGAVLNNAGEWGASFSMNLLGGGGPAYLIDQIGFGYKTTAFTSTEIANLHQALYDYVNTPPNPAVTSVVPVSGSSAGGTTVTINGTRFQSGCTVTFGGTSATSVTFVSASQITCAIPAHAIGYVDVVVTNPDTYTSVGFGGTSAFSYYTSAMDTPVSVGDRKGWFSPDIIQSALFSPVGAIEPRTFALDWVFAPKQTPAQTISPSGIATAYGSGSATVSHVASTQTVNASGDGIASDELINQPLVSHDPFVIDPTWIYGAPIDPTITGYNPNGDGWLYEFWYDLIDTSGTDGTTFVWESSVWSVVSAGSGLDDLLEGLQEQTSGANAVIQTTTPPGKVAVSTANTGSGFSGLGVSNLIFESPMSAVTVFMDVYQPVYDGSGNQYWEFEWSHSGSDLSVYAYDNGTNTILGVAVSDNSFGGTNTWAFEGPFDFSGSTAGWHRLIVEFVNGVSCTVILNGVVQTSLTAIDTDGLYSLGSFFLSTGEWSLFSNVNAGQAVPAWASIGVATRDDGATFTSTQRSQTDAWLLSLIGGSPQTASPSAISPAYASGSAKLNLKAYPTGLASSYVSGSARMIYTMHPSGVVTAYASGTAKLNEIAYPTGLASAFAAGSAKLNETFYPSGAVSSFASGSAKLNETIYATALGSSYASGTARLGLFALPSGVATSYASGSARMLVNILPSGVGTGFASGAPALSNLSTVLPTGLSSSYASGSATVSDLAHVSPTGIGTSYTSGSARLALSVIPAAIATAYGSGTLKITLALLPSAITSAEAEGTPRFTVDVTPTGVSSNFASGTLTTSNVTTLSPSALSSSYASGTATLHGLDTVTPNGLASAYASGAALVLPGGVTASPVAISSAEALGADSLSRAFFPVGLGSSYASGSQTLSAHATIAPAALGSAFASGSAQISLRVLPTGLGSSFTSGSATISPGAAPVSASGISGAEAFGNLIASAGGVFLVPVAIASVYAAGTAVVAPGAAPLHPVGLGSSYASGSATLASIIAVFPTGVSSAAAIGNALLSAGVATLHPAAVASSFAAGAALVSPGAVTISPSGVSSSFAGGSPFLGAFVTVTAITSAASIPAPKLNERLYTIAIPAGFAAGVARFSLFVRTAGLASAEAEGAPSLNLRIAATAMASAFTSGAAAVESRSVLAPTGVAGREAFGALRLVSVLSPSSVASLAAFGATKVAYAVLHIQAAAVSSAEVVGQPTFQVFAFVHPSAVPSSEAIGAYSVFAGLEVKPSGLTSGALVSAPIIAAWQVFRVSFDITEDGDSPVGPLVIVGMVE